MVQKHASTRWSSSFVAIKARIITCLVATLIVTLFAPLAPATAINPGDLDTTFGNNGSIELTTQHEIDGQLVDFNGNTLVWGFTRNNFETIHFLARYNGLGVLDEDFGKDGYFYLQRSFWYESVPSEWFNCIVNGITQVTSVSIEENVYDNGDGIGAYLIALKAICSTEDANGQVVELKEIHFLQRLLVDDVNLPNPQVDEFGQFPSDVTYLEFFAENLESVSASPKLEFVGLKVAEMELETGTATLKIAISGDFNLQNTLDIRYYEYATGQEVRRQTFFGPGANGADRIFARNPQVDSGGNVVIAGAYAIQNRTRDLIERKGPSSSSILQSADPCIVPGVSTPVTQSTITDIAINWNDDVYVLVNCTFGEADSKNFLRKYNSNLSLYPEYLGNSAQLLDPPGSENAKPRAMAIGTEDQVVVLFDEFIPNTGFKTWLARYDYLGALDVTNFGTSGFTSPDDFPVSAIGLGLDIGGMDVIHLLVGTQTSGPPEYAIARFFASGLDTGYGALDNSGEPISNSNEFIDDGFVIVFPPDTHVNVERVATDDEDRIVVLASFSDGYYDNHILFRLSENGSHDQGFGSRTLNGDSYVRVETTSLYYVFERVDLEIDSQDRMLVMLSGSFDYGISGGVNFVERYLDDGSIDAYFGNEGRIDLSPDGNELPLFLTDLSLDKPTTGGGFLVAGFIPIPGLDAYFGLGLQVHKFDETGAPVTEFGNKDDLETTLIDENYGVADIDTELLLGLPCGEENCDDVIMSDVRIVSDHADGYTIAYFGVTNFGEGIVPSTGLVRLTSDGVIDEEFACVEVEESACVEDDFLEIFSSSDSFFPAVDNHRLLHGFIFTDIVPDGFQPDAGILISGTFAPEIFGSSGAVSLLLRIKMDGAFDQSFSQSARINGYNYILNPPSSGPDGTISYCYNQALFRNVDRSDSITALIVGDICDLESSDGASALLAFLKSGDVDEKFGPGGGVFISPVDSDSVFSNLITQLEQTKNGKLLVLRGAEPTSGIFGFQLKLASLLGAAPDLRDSVVTISRYHLRKPVTFELMRGSETSTASVAVTESATVGVVINSYNVKLSNKTGVFSGDADSSFSISPSLPAGLSFDTSTARISGVPTVPLATQTFTITGQLVTLSEFGYVYTDIATATYTLTVNAAATPPSPPAPPAPPSPPAPPAPTPPVPVVVYVPPKPVPYLRTISAPQLKLKENKLVCSAGTYQTGNTLEGVIQPSSITPFTPISFLFNLLVGGITQTSLSITAASSSASWDVSKVPAGSVVSCSVTVSANGVTNTDKSSDNTSGLSNALSAQSNSIATANATYAAAVSANEKAYQKALVDNRAKWRSETEKIRTDYYAERDRIKSLPSTKSTRAQASAALKAYTAAHKKSAADYKASQPAAATARDAANKAALDAKNAAIAKANAAYGTAIEAIGYGVLIP